MLLRFIAVNRNRLGYNQREANNTTHNDILLINWVEFEIHKLKRSETFFVRQWFGSFIICYEYTTSKQCFFFRSRCLYDRKVWVWKFTICKWSFSTLWCWKKQWKNKSRRFENNFSAIMTLIMAITSELFWFESTTAVSEDSRTSSGKILRKIGYFSPKKIALLANTAILFFLLKQINHKLWHLRIKTAIK